jgi:hypothetical protein
MTSAILNKRTAYKSLKSAQYHPFHILASSKLPIFMATFAGFLALSFITKLHSIDYVTSLNYSLVTAQILEPYFTTVNLNSLSINSLLLVIIIAIVAIMLS